MNIFTFDIEEWYVEKHFREGSSERYQVYDRYLKMVLDLLDETGTQGTFFCVGGLANEFGNVVRTIADRGHEIGCHSNEHRWLDGLTRREMKEDTERAVKSLEDLIGCKVVSYRAPAFSIGKGNKWAFEVLAECGIERDASVYPAVREFGGFEDFGAAEPVVIKIGDVVMKEFPVSLVSFGHRRMAYSGGGYFRVLPLGFVKSVMRKKNYNMAYFHITDIEYHPYKMISRYAYEKYYMREGTFRNRFVRMMKRCTGSKGAFDKMCSLVRNFDFLSIKEADGLIDWNVTKKINL